MATQQQRNIIRIANPPLENNPRTLLTADVAVGAISLSILSKIGFTLAERGGNFYVMIGDYGQENTEIKLVTANDTDNKLLIVAALSNSHSASDPITFIPYNKINFYGLTEEAGSKNLLASVQIDVTKQITEYAYTGSTYDYFCSAYYDSVGDIISGYSDIIESNDFGRYSAKKVIESALKRAMTKIDESANAILNWSSALDVLNDGIDEILAEKRKWQFLHKIDSTRNTVAGTEYVELPDDLSLLEVVKYNGIKLDYASHTYYNQLTSTEIVETSEPVYYTIKDGKCYFYPKPGSVKGITYEYYKIPEAITSLKTAVDSPFVIPLIYYCASQFCFIRGNDKRGDKMYLLFQKKLTNQIEEYSGPEQVGDAEKVERTNSIFWED